MTWECSSIFEYVEFDSRTESLRKRARKGLIPSRELTRSSLNVRSGGMQSSGFSKVSRRRTDWLLARVR